MKWEYKTARINGSLTEMLKSERGLNELGEDGWELVAVISDIVKGVNSLYQGVAYFKRPVRNETFLSEAKARAMEKEGLVDPGSLF